MPEYERSTNLYYNAVALMGPNGEVVGVYRKRNNLLEASYNSEVWSPVPTYDTPYGRIAVVICADMFYDAFPRLAALAGATILLAPANVGITTDFMKVRTWENDFSMIVANRFGHGTKGSKATYFNQDTFAIPSPFDYDFSGSQTAIVSNRQEVLAVVSDPKTAIAYADLPVRKSHLLPVVRRPSLYPLLAQDTLETYTLGQFGLPAPATFAVAAVDPGQQSDPWPAALSAVQNALDAAKGKGMSPAVDRAALELFPGARPRRNGAFQIPCDRQQRGRRRRIRGEHSSEVSDDRLERRDLRVLADPSAPRREDRR